MPETSAASRPTRVQVTPAFGPSLTAAQRATTAARQRRSVQRRRPRIWGRGSFVPNSPRGVSWPNLRIGRPRAVDAGCRVVRGSLVGARGETVVALSLVAQTDPRHGKNDADTNMDVLARHDAAALSTLAAGADPGVRDRGPRRPGRTSCPRAARPRGRATTAGEPSSNHGNVTAYANPCAPISGGLIARAAANNSSVPANAAAAWTVTRPNAETVITGVELSAEIYRSAATPSTTGPPGSPTTRARSCGVTPRARTYTSGPTAAPTSRSASTTARRSSSASDAPTAPAARPRAAATRHRTIRAPAPRSTAHASR